MKLTKQTIIDNIFELNNEEPKGEPITKKQVAEIVDKVLGTIAFALEAGDEVRIFNFGTFKTSAKPERQAHNPRTGESITVPARRVVTFKPAKSLREAVNNNK